MKKKHYNANDACNYYANNNHDANTVNEYKIYFC